MREHDDCMTYETVAKEAPGGDSSSVSEQILRSIGCDRRKREKFKNFNIFSLLKRNLNLN